MPKKSHFHHLHKKWSHKHATLKKTFHEKHQEVQEWMNENPKQLAIGAASSLMLLAAPPTVAALPPPHESVIQNHFVVIDQKTFVLADLLPFIPDEVRPLSVDEEVQIGEILTKHYGITISAELEGKRLNRSYGYIGQEQHLYRYPGDSLFRHADSPSDWDKYSKYGIAPGLGAFGYFAPSEAEFTEQDKMREKYYIAAQTFLVPDYNTRTREYVEFFKFRKMLVVNPHTGKAVVVVIGDAGPGRSTGKHLGGSPEVMQHLERVDGARKGPVLYFFIDDPNDTIPLGPIEPKS
jgi:hypothetical protein